MLLLGLASFASASTSLYYRPLPSGYARYKFEGIRMLVNPQMNAVAARFTADERVAELITTALALDSFIYDGLRLVRLRGLLMHEGAIDEDAVGRAILYFNVNRQEALAWLVTSRLLALTGFQEGVSVEILESEMIATAEDLHWRLQTYFSTEEVNAFMPHLAWAQGTVLSVRSIEPVNFDPPHEFSPELQLRTVPPRKNVFIKIFGR